MARGSKRRRRTLVTTVVEQPPTPPPQKRKKKKKNMATSVPAPSLSLLPEEILLNCLARISKSQYRSLSLVSKTIRSLLSSTEIYTVRSRVGNAEPFLYLCQEFPSLPDRWFADRNLITDGWIKDESSLLPIITPSTSDIPSKPTTLAVGFEIYQMGGTIKDRPSSAVRVLDCRTHTWRDAPDMMVPRKSPESAFIDGKIYVIGGTEVVDVFELKSQTWKPLPRFSDDAKAEFYMGELHATSKGKRYAYDSKQGTWKELGFDPEHKSLPWCVVENVKFVVLERKLMWFDSDRSKWLLVEGLEYPVVSFPRFFCNNTRARLFCSPTIQLANHGGKIVLLWDEARSLEFPLAGQTQKHRCEYKRFLCAVVKLEKRIGLSGLEIWGKIERSNAVLTVPDSYKFLSCITR